MAPPRKKRRLSPSTTTNATTNAPSTSKNMIEDDVAPAEDHACPTCSQSFPTHRSLALHGRTHVEKPKGPCPYCSTIITLRRDGSLPTRSRHFGTSKCKKARLRVEYERQYGPLEPEQRLPAVRRRKEGEGEARKRRKKRPVRPFLDELNEQIAYTEHRMTGLGKKREREKDMDPRKTGGSRTVVPPFDECWREDEKQRFFYALERYSRLRPELIAEDVGTRTLAEVDAYLALLASYALTAKPIEDNAVSCADETSEEWIRWEERQAARTRSYIDAQEVKARGAEPVRAREEARKEGAGNLMMRRVEMLQTREDLLSNLSWQHLVNLGRDHSAKGAGESKQPEDSAEGEDEEPKAMDIDEDKALLSSSDEEVDLEASPPLRKRSASPLVPSIDWREVEAEETDDSVSLPRRQLEAAAISRVDFGSAELLDLHAVGTLLQSYRFIYEDPLLAVDGHISLEALITLADLVRHHLATLLAHVFRLAELGFAGCPSARELDELVNQVVRSAQYEGPIDGRDRLRTLRDAIRLRETSTVPPPPQTQHYGFRCPDCRRWLELPSASSMADDAQLQRHRKKGCHGAPSGWSIPPSVPLYHTTIEGIAAASTTVPPPTPFPPGGVALPHVFDPPPMLGTTIVPAYKETEKASFEEREQDELWKDAHLDRADRLRAREVERQLWLEYANTEPPERDDISEVEEWEEVEVKEKKSRQRPETAPLHAVSKEVIDSSDEEV